MRKKTVSLEAGQNVTLGASGYLPIFYRILFDRDIFQDVAAVHAVLRGIAEEETRQEAENKTKAPEAVSEAPKKAETVSEAPKKAEEGNGETVVANLNAIDILSLARIEYAMARHAEPDTVPDTMEAWLSSLDEMSAIYSLMNAALELYAADAQTTTSAKKKQEQPTAP